jgi:hypothetical protein
MFDSTILTSIAPLNAEGNAPSFPCVVIRFGLESSWKRRSVSHQESCLNTLKVHCSRVRGKAMNNREFSLAELLI